MVYVILVVVLAFLYWRWRQSFKPARRRDVQAAANRTADRVERTVRSEYETMAQENAQLREENRRLRGEQP